MNGKNLRNNSTMAFLCMVLACCVLALSANAQVAAKQKKVTTVAGGYVGDGKPATSAALAQPIGVARDAKGNLYVSDSINCRIRKITTKGTISTFAGTGICGYSGDGGPAKSAMMSGPAGIAFDGQGNLLFADQWNSRIRKITSDGTISTLAGNGTLGYSGDGGPATQATLDYPSGISVDPSGNVYIADSDNYVIRMVDTGGIIRTVAGNHTWGFSGDGGPATSAQINTPSSVLSDNSGNFYIADGGNERVRKVDSSGIITTYAGNGLSGNGGNGGPATSASIGYPEGLLLGANRLYISTGSNVWAVDQASQIINIVAGDLYAQQGFSGDGGNALSTLFLFLQGLAFDATGNLLIADSGNNRIRRIDPSQTVNTIAGGYVGDGKPAKSASLTVPLGGGQMAFDGAGNFYFADTNNNRIRKASATGIITTVAGTGITGYSGDGGPATAATLNAPMSAVPDGIGNLFIADTNNSSIRKVDATGTITTLSLGIFVSPHGLALDGLGNLYVADWSGNVIWKVPPAGPPIIVAGVLYHYGYNGDGIPATQAWVLLPTAITLDHAGNLYIADWLNQRIRKVNSNGIITTVAGNGTQGFGGDGGPGTSAMLSLPLGMAADAKGNLYIADWSNFRVRIVDPSGTINTYAGTGNYGYNGNNLPATATNMDPAAVATDAKGKVYLADMGSFRVRKIH